MARMKKQELKVMQYRFYLISIMKGMGVSGIGRETLLTAAIGLGQGKMIESDTEKEIELAQLAMESIMRGEDPLVEYDSTKDGFVLKPLTGTVKS